MSAGRSWKGKAARVPNPLEGNDALVANDRVVAELLDWRSRQIEIDAGVLEKKKREGWRAFGRGSVRADGRAGQAARKVGEGG